MFGQRPTIADLAEEPPRPEAEAIDSHARAILDGFGPEEWTLPDGRVVERGDVLYSRGGGIYSVVFPNGDRNDRSGICALAERGRLTIRGFSQERTAALVQYATPTDLEGEDDDDERGFSCDTDSYFFYPAPPLLEEQD